MLAEIANPLFDLTAQKRVDYTWSDVHDRAFEDLKKAFVSPPILGYPVFNNPNYKFILTTDASDRAIGAVLSQTDGKTEWMIQYASKTLSKAERNYSTTEREALAIVKFAKMFRPYLYGYQFTI